MWAEMKCPFSLIGQAIIKWCCHHVLFSFVQQNKSPPLLKHLLQLLRSSPSHQTTRLTNQTNKWFDTNHTGAAPRQGLLLCRHMAIIRCFLQKYMYLGSAATLHFYFLGTRTPHILFSCPVIKICVAKLCDIYIIVNWHCTNIPKLASSNLCALQKLAFCK